MTESALSRLPALIRRPAHLALFAVLGFGIDLRHPLHVADGIKGAALLLTPGATQRFDMVDHVR